jgi:hypothetical protein
MGQELCCTGSLAPHIMHGAVEQGPLGQYCQEEDLLVDVVHVHVFVVRDCRLGNHFCIYQLLYCIILYIE